MDKDHETTRPPEGEQSREGAAVFDAAGDKVGTVAAHNHHADFVIVEKGWLFPKNCAVPRSAIARTNSTGVYLTLSKDELLYQVKDDLTSLNWDPPDTVDAMSGRGTPHAREHVVDRIPLSGAEQTADLTPAVVERVITVPAPADEADGSRGTLGVETMRLHKEERTEPQEGSETAHPEG